MYWESARTSPLTKFTRSWLNLEPFISPSLFEPYLNTSKPAVDEWSLCENLGRNMPRVLKRHYDTFIVSTQGAQSIVC